MTKKFLDFFHKIGDDHLFYANFVEEQEREDYEAELIDDIFEEEQWIDNFNKKTFDCRKHKTYHESGRLLSCSEVAKQLLDKCAPNETGHEYWCLNHMTSKEFGALVEKTIDQTLKEEIDKAMLVEAKLKVKKEFELVFDRGYSPLVLPKIYIEAGTTLNLDGAAFEICWKIETIIYIKK